MIFISGSDISFYLQTILNVLQWSGLKQQVQRGNCSLESCVPSRSMVEHVTPLARLLAYMHEKTYRTKTGCINVLSNGEHMTSETRKRLQ
jgi:hypothetical protein